MKLFKLIFVTYLILNSGKILNAQKLNMHFGYNFNAVSRMLDFSSFGLRVYANYIYFHNCNLRTNLSINYHNVKNVPETPSLEDCFYTQIEETAVYQFDENIFNLFCGLGIGYYSINNNGQSDHFQQIDPLNYDEKVGHEIFDSNFGIHFLIGKDLGSIILEIKYSYVTFPYHITHQGTIDNNYVDQIFSKDYTFHFLGISLGI